MERKPKYKASYVQEYSKFCNAKHFWYQTDSEEAFKKNLEKFPDHPTLTLYKDNPITYNINNLGFRSDFDYKAGQEGNLYIGCSSTEGIGLHFSDVFSSLVNKELEDGLLINLGLGGTGIDSWSRILLQYLDFFKIKRVFVLGYNWARYEFFNDDRYFKFSLNQDVKSNPITEPYFNFIRDFLYNDNYICHNYEIKINGMENICRKRNIPFYLVRGDDRRLKPIKSLGRDLLHFGPEYHRKIAKLFIYQVRFNEQ